MGAVRKVRCHKGAVRKVRCHKGAVEIGECNLLPGNAVSLLQKALRLPCAGSYAFDFTVCQK